MELRSVQLCILDTSARESSAATYTMILGLTKAQRTGAVDSIAATGTVLYVASTCSYADSVCN